MGLSPSLPDGALEAVGAFIEDHIADAGASGAVLGLSGGVDSALVAALASKALGAKRLSTLFLPIERAPAGDLADARATAKKFKASFEVRDLTGPFFSLAEATN